MTAALATLNQAALVTLADCEQRIERGMKTFIDVGQALAEIRDSRLYKGTHETFEDYCRERWGFSRQRAQQFTAAAELATTIVDTGLPSPTNEGQARALSQVPEADRYDVWREANERTGGKPTAKVVREITEERTKTPESAEPQSTAPAGSGLVEQIFAVLTGADPHGLNAAEINNALPERVNPDHLVDVLADLATGVCLSRSTGDGPTRWLLTQPESAAAEPTSAPMRTALADPVAPAREADPFADWSQAERILLDGLREGETVVVSMRHHGNLIAWATEAGLYERVDRKSVWGNPFLLDQDGTREQVIEAYAEHYLPHKPSLLARIGDLQGKALGCWCAPEPCHADVLRHRAETEA